MLEIKLDTERCQGHLRCLSIAEDLFDVDDLGYAVVIPDDGVVPSGREDDARLAVANCPESALSLSETI